MLDYRIAESIGKQFRLVHKRIDSISKKSKRKSITAQRTFPATLVLANSFSTQNFTVNGIDNTFSINSFIDTASTFDILIYSVSYSSNNIKITIFNPTGININIPLGTITFFALKIDSTIL